MAAVEQGIPREIAIVVCTKDRPFRVSEFVDNLLNLDTGPALLLLVDSTTIDSGFRKNEMACDRLRTQGWDVVHIPDRAGLPHQRNTGLTYLQNQFPEIEIACFLDDDISVNPDYFQNVHQLFQRDRSLVVVGGFDSRTRSTRKRPLRLLVNLGILPSAPGLIARSGLAAVPMPTAQLEFVDFVPGGMQSINLKKLGINRFDEASQFFGEDLEMHFRLASVGKIGASDLLPVEHLEATEGKHDNGRQAFNEHIVRLRLHLTDSYRVKFSAMIAGDLLVMASDLMKALRKFALLEFFQMLTSHLGGIVMVITRKILGAPNRPELKH